MRIFRGDSEEGERARNLSEGTVRDNTVVATNLVAPA